MHCDLVVQPNFPRIVKRIIRRTKVSLFVLATRGWYCPRRKQRGFGTNSFIRTVRVPLLVTFIKSDLETIGLGDLPVARGITKLCRQVRGRFNQPLLHSPKVSRECDLFLCTQVLIFKYEHSKLFPSRFNLIEFLARQACQIDACNECTQCRVAWLDLH